MSRKSCVLALIALLAHSACPYTASADPVLVSNLLPDGVVSGNFFSPSVVDATDSWAQEFTSGAFGQPGVHPGESGPAQCRDEQRFLADCPAHPGDDCLGRSRLRQRCLGVVSARLDLNHRFFQRRVRPVSHGQPRCVEILLVCLDRFLERWNGRRLVANLEHSG